MMIVATTISPQNRNSLFISFLLISFFCFSPLLAKSIHPITVCILTIFFFFDFTFLYPFGFSFLGVFNFCRMFKLGTTSFNVILILTGFLHSLLFHKLHYKLLCHFYYKLFVCKDLIHRVLVNIVQFIATLQYAGAKFKPGISHLFTLRVKL
jgi:hypothetical protein